MANFQLSDDVYKEVVRLANKYHKQAKICLDAHAYLAGCIMIGAAFEDALLSFANCYPEEALNASAAPRIKGKVKPLMDWSLSNLLAVARECNWLPAGLSTDEDWDDAKAQIGDYAIVVKDIRNLVHPARYVIDWNRKRVTKKYLEAVFEIFEVANDYLLSKLYQSIREEMEGDNAKDT